MLAGWWRNQSFADAPRMNDASSFSQLRKAVVAYHIAAATSDVGLATCEEAVIRLRDATLRDAGLEPTSFTFDGPISSAMLAAIRRACEKSQSQPAGFAMSSTVASYALAPASSHERTSSTTPVPAQKLTSEHRDTAFNEADVTPAAMHLGSARPAAGALHLAASKLQPDNVDAAVADLLPFASPASAAIIQKYARKRMEAPQPPSSLAGDSPCTAQRSSATSTNALDEFASLPLVPTATASSSCSLIYSGRGEEPAQRWGSQALAEAKQEVQGVNSSGSGAFSPDLLVFAQRQQGSTAALDPSATGGLKFMLSPQEKKDIVTRLLAERQAQRLGGDTETDARATTETRSTECTDTTPLMKAPSKEWHLGMLRGSADWDAAAALRPVDATSSKHTPAFNVTLQPRSDDSDIDGVVRPDSMTASESDLMNITMAFSGHGAEELPHHRETHSFSGFPSRLTDTSLNGTCLPCTASRPGARHGAGTVMSGVPALSTTAAVGGMGRAHYDPYEGTAPSQEHTASLVHHTMSNSSDFPRAIQKPCSQLTSDTDGAGSNGRGSVLAHQRYRDACHALGHTMYALADVACEERDAATTPSEIGAAPTASLSQQHHPLSRVGSAAHGRLGTARALAKPATSMPWDTSLLNSAITNSASGGSLSCGTATPVSPGKEDSSRAAALQRVRNVMAQKRSEDAARQSEAQIKAERMRALREHTRVQARARGVSHSRNRSNATLAASSTGKEPLLADQLDTTLRGVRPSRDKQTHTNALSLPNETVRSSGATHSDDGHSQPHHHRQSPGSVAPFRRGSTASSSCFPTASEIGYVLASTSVRDDDSTEDAPTGLPQVDAQLSSTGACASNDAFSAEERDYEATRTESESENSWRNLHARLPSRELPLRQPGGSTEKPHRRASPRTSSVCSGGGASSDSGTNVNCCDSGTSRDGVRKIGTTLDAASSSHSTVDGTATVSASVAARSVGLQDCSTVNTLRTRLAVEDKLAEQARQRAIQRAAARKRDMAAKQAAETAAEAARQHEKWATRDSRLQAFTSRQGMKAAGMHGSNSTLQSEHGSDAAQQNSNQSGVLPQLSAALAVGRRKAATREANEVTAERQVHTAAASWQLALQRLETSMIDPDVAWPGMTERPLPKPRAASSAAAAAAANVSVSARATAARDSDIRVTTSIRTSVTLTDATPAELQASSSRREGGVASPQLLHFPSSVFAATSDGDLDGRTILHPRQPQAMSSLPTASSIWPLSAWPGEPSFSPTAPPETAPLSASTAPPETVPLNAVTAETVTLNAVTAPGGEFDLLNISPPCSSPAVLPSTSLLVEAEGRGIFAWLDTSLAADMSLTLFERSQHGAHPTSHPEPNAHRVARDESNGGAGCGVSRSDNMVRYKPGDSSKWAGAQAPVPRSLSLHTASEETAAQTADLNDGSMLLLNLTRFDEY